VGELLFVAAILLAWTRSGWAALALLAVLALGALHSLIGLRMYAEGRAGLQDGRNHPFRVLRAYGAWCRERGRQPLWTFLAVPLWVLVVVSAVAGVALHR